MAQSISIPNIDIKTLRHEISKEYTEVANNPAKGFHFHTGRKLAKMLGYHDEWIDKISINTVESFAGTGNPFSLGEIKQGEQVLDIGSGAGFDSLIAAQLVGKSGHVIGVDMTPAMLKKAKEAAEKTGLTNVDFLEGYAESLPVSDGWADVVISNGVINLCPDKPSVFKEIYRALKPGGRMQIGDILVQKAVSDSAKEDIELWTG